MEVPFENMLFNKFTGTDLQVGYSLDASYSPYITKPLLLYKFGGITLVHDIRYTDGASHFPNLNYTMFGQDLTNNGIQYSLNFAPETSSYWLYPIQQSIFATYYFPYLANLFNAKNRLTTLKANLPVSLLTQIQLNDRLIIRDKRYIINQMKTNMITGTTEFELLNDFMPVEPEKIINTVPEQTQVIVGVTFPNANAKTSAVTGAIFTTQHSDVVIDPAEIRTEQNTQITLPEYSGLQETFFIEIEYQYANGEVRNGQIIIIR
jgi:hypothetical protein